MTPRLAQWGKVKPFLIEEVASFSPPGPLPVESAAYAKDITRSVRWEAPTASSVPRARLQRRFLDGIDPGAL